MWYDEKKRDVMKKIRILFVCHGNICRSPMAEFLMKDLVAKRGVADRFEIASAATSTEELGNPVYPPARRKLAEHDLRCDGKTAVQMKKADYEKYDYLVCMDSWNLRNMHRITGGDPQNKFIRLLDLTDLKRDVADPWYTDDFDATWDDLTVGCEALLEKLLRKERS